MFFSFQRPLESSLKLVFSIPNGEFWKFFVIQHSFSAHSLHARFPSIHILGTIFAIIGKVFLLLTHYHANQVMARIVQTDHLKYCIMNFGKENEGIS